MEDILFDLEQDGSADLAFWGQMEQSFQLHSCQLDSFLLDYTAAAAATGQLSPWSSLGSQAMFPDAQLTFTDLDVQSPGAATCSEADGGSCALDEPLLEAGKRRAPRRLVATHHPYKVLMCVSVFLSIY